MDIIFATKNEHKLIEIREILSDLNRPIISMTQAGIDVSVVEDGETFSENAIKKAVEIMKFTGKVTLADDSGIEIDFLDKKPGVYSARFLGEDTPYEIKNKQILEMLKDVPYEKRTARFVCVIAAAFPNNEIITAQGTIEGVIAYEAKGKNGFGYDPIFYVPKYEMTTAQMPSSLKNEISHRGNALRLMKEKIFKIL